MLLYTAVVHPGKALGFMVLGTTLHDTLTRLKAEPQKFRKIELVYSPTNPASEPVIVNLPSNGLRLRFDGPQQRLRLIEVLDFSKSKLTYNGTDITKAAGSTAPVTGVQDSSAGPFFRHVYSHLLGPAFPGEYVPLEEESSQGLYVLSYPGIAFTFPVQKSAWSQEKDHIDLLSSSATSPASSMAIFIGESWAEARPYLYIHNLPDPIGLAPQAKSRENYADEIDLVMILGQGRLLMRRPWRLSPFWLTLGQTTPQDLVAELGPPDAIYRKNDQRMLIHKTRTASESRPRPSMNDSRLQDDSTDTDQSSTHTATDGSGDESDQQDLADPSDECFYNYFYHGFDILISSPVQPSPKPPSALPQDAKTPLISTTSPLVATKIILHGNVPGSYSFNRHRRCRWEISYLSHKKVQTPPNSETPFAELQVHLGEEWKEIYGSEEEARQRQRGMVLNRGWGDSPGSSCELLGGWEDSTGGKKEFTGVVSEGEQGLGNTTLFGYPGLVFEVLKNGTVSGLTVF